MQCSVQNRSLFLFCSNTSKAPGLGDFSKYHITFLPLESDPGAFLIHQEVGQEQVPCNATSEKKSVSSAKFPTRQTPPQVKISVLTCLTGDVTGIIPIYKVGKKPLASPPTKPALPQT